MIFDDLRHSQRERLIFLDRCLTWRGMANRRDLIERFAISQAQAALDFRLYLQRAGEHGPVYDPVRRAYFVTPQHRSLASAPIAEAFQDVFLEKATGLSNVLPRPERRADEDIVAQLYQASLAKEEVYIHYTSMTSGKDGGQWIAPRHFLSDGESVYVRAFSYKHQEYRNYLPIRIGDSDPFERRSRCDQLPADLEWTARARVWLRPKSTLSEQQAEAVRREYGFDGELLSIETRKALEFFVARRWGLNLPGARLEYVRTDYEPIGSDDGNLHTERSS
ncbi:hypothetical protein [Mesorhizobium sp. M0909]|uniref:hypothetical protein n=1 Tax=Mesorhizobium sp. M0909 TaxID=2957024 RepID=UPI00333C5BFE